jgi:hypothetical protein
MNQLHLPELMPDEYILGYLGRIGTLNGFRNEREIRAALRKQHNQNRPGTKGTLLEFLSEISRLDTYNFAQHHTLFPAFRAVASYLHEHNHGDPRDFGLLSAHAPRLMRNDIQLCAECVNEDMDYCGFSFWRRSHQLPGVDWCPKHATPLYQVEKKIGFFIAPSAAIELAFDSNSYVEALENNPIVSRFIQLMLYILDFPRPISPSAIAPYLSKKNKSAGLRTDQQGNNSLISDLALNQLPQEWTKKHFPTLANKMTNQFTHEYDGVCKTGGKAHASISYILASAVLCKTTEEGQNLWWEALKTPDKTEKEQHAPAPISRRRIKSAYVSSKGNIKKMAEDMNQNYNSLSNILKTMGLPSLSAMTPSTIQAVLDFCQKKASLQEILSRPNIQVHYFSEALRTAMSPHSTLISTVLWNKKLSASNACEEKVLSEKIS